MVKAAIAFLCLTNTGFRIGRNFVNSKVSTTVLILFTHANADNSFQDTIDDEATYDRKATTSDRANDLAHQ